MPPRRSPQRLLAIVDAAMEVFAQKGFAAAQMVDVARMAGVSVGTLYNYVEGKGALLLLCAERPFADISAGRDLPVPAPDRTELVSRLEETLERHVRIPALDRALAAPLRRARVDQQIRVIVGELFDLIAVTRVAADAMEQSARDAPDLGELFYRRVRVRLLDQLVEYCGRVDAVRPLTAPLTPELAARSVLETATWWARHRHRDPAPPNIDDAQAREIATVLVAGSLLMPASAMNRRALAVAMVVVAAACSRQGPSVHGATPATRRATSTTGVKSRPVSRADLDAIASRYRAACKSPGAGVSLRTRDGTEYALSGRFAPGVALGVDSQFLAGSVTKLFVAAVAYQLIAARKLSLDDPVDRYVSNWPNGNRITIAMLLGHRSGMGDFGNDFGKQLQALVLSDLKRDFTYREVLDLVRGVPPVAPPGATYHYSNANYIVLGAILQRLTHESLGRLIDARVIKPLRLTRTLYGPDDLAAANKIVFHGLFDVGGTGTPVDIGGFPRNAALTVDPAGAGLFSSLPDLLTVTHALFATDDVLAAAQRSGLDRAVSTLSAKDLLLGNSFVIHGHGGASPGAQTIVAYDRAHDVTVAVWCNRLDPGEYELLPSVIAARDTFELAARAPGIDRWTASVR